MKTGHFFSKLDSKRIVDAIGRAEAGTSGEIRVHVTRHEPKDIEARARQRFEALHMTKTADRNGVLFYIAPRIQKFQILGDTGVHEKCGDGFWKETAEQLSEAFRRGDFTGGLVAGIEKIGQVLKEHFPHREDDKNELPDEVSED